MNKLKELKKILDIFNFIRKDEEYQHGVTSEVIFTVKNSNIYFQYKENFDFLFMYFKKNMFKIFPENVRIEYHHEDVLIFFKTVDSVIDYFNILFKTELRKNKLERIL